MVLFQELFSAITEFLNGAQTLGCIKNYAVTCSDNFSENSETKELISKFLNAVNGFTASESGNSTKENVKVATEIVSSSSSEAVCKKEESPEPKNGSAVQKNLITTESVSSSSSETVSKEEEEIIEVCDNDSAVQKNLVTTENVSSSSSEAASKNEVKTKAVCENDSDMQKNLVQLQVDKSEINRRISAFISRKRKEVDEWNVQEFCSRPYVEEQNPLWEELDSCARVDTVFVPRSGSKSHVKVYKVENRWGPQTHMHSEAKKVKQELIDESEDKPNIASLQAIEERLESMECHLKLKTESTRTNIFNRLKNLEDRILYLEGISPDYFNLSGTDYQTPKKKSIFEKTDTTSVNDLQKRIQALQESLKMRQAKLTE